MAISGVAYRQTWIDFAPADDGFFDFILLPVLRLVRAVRRAAVTLVRRLLHRPVVGGGGAVTATATVKATGRVSTRLQFGSLPTDVRDALAALADRTQRLSDMLMATREQIEGESARSQETTQTLREEFAADVARVEGRAQRVAVGGMRLQAFGLVLIGLGVVLGVWPS